MSIPTFIGAQVDKVFGAALSPEILSLSEEKHGAASKARALLLSTAAKKLPAKTLYPAIIRLHASLDGAAKEVRLLPVSYPVWPPELTFVPLHSPFSGFLTCSTAPCDTAKRQTSPRVIDPSSSCSSPFSTFVGSMILRSVLRFVPLGVHEMPRLIRPALTGHRRDRRERARRLRSVHTQAERADLPSSVPSYVRLGRHRPGR